jgi:transglutaminase-like putative cysteine protease
MHRITLTLVILICPILASAQDNYGFPYGKTTFMELDQKEFTPDTSASAYVIKEVAEAHVDYESNNRIIFTYHVKIRILKQQGADEANVIVPLQKAKDRKELIRDVQASSYNIVNNRIVETPMEKKSVFMEKNSDYQDNAKFAIPNVKAGTIIEYQYIIESPFLYNFRRWEFQSHLPKLHSEYWTVIPANYTYNTTLRGYQNLTSRSSDVIPGCIAAGNGAVADCVRNKYLMKNIPAFREEEYMIAKNNFLSAINFELKEVKHWDGRVDNVTKEWKDADDELNRDARFGQEIKRGKNLGGAVEKLIAGTTDRLEMAKKIYDFVKYEFMWNGNYGFYCNEKGINKAFEEKKGNVGDINLTLIAALKAAQIQVEPVLLATRHIERPTELHPALSDFNYVIARVTIDGKNYLLDAVDDYLAFGNIREVCYNGKARVISEAGSYWIDLKPTDRNRKFVQSNLKLSNDGMITGSVTNTYFGYAAVDFRKELASYQNDKEYVDKLRSKHQFLTITAYEKVLDEDLSKAVVEKITVEFPAFESKESAHFLFNPFLMEANPINPFKTEKRAFPIDYGVPHDLSLSLNLEYPENIEVTSMPDKIGNALPNGGGRYIFAAQNDGKKLTVSSVLNIAKPVYEPEEYPYLRELYSKMIQVQNTDIIFQKKK